MKEMARPETILENYFLWLVEAKIAFSNSFLSFILLCVYKPQSTTFLNFKLLQWTELNAINKSYFLNLISGRFFLLLLFSLVEFFSIIQSTLSRMGAVFFSATT